MRVLVTGGAGYIGSHATLLLLAAGHEVCVVDNFCNSSPEALSRVTRLSNRQLTLRAVDIRDLAGLRAAFAQFTPDAAMHFAGLKSPTESFQEPVRYYDTNVQGSLALLQAMTESGCGRLVFSSSATVYGDPHYLPCDENHPLAPNNPYGRTKLVAEQLIADWAAATPGAAAASLRYFNPVGAHPSGRIGEDPRGIPNNLFPFVSQVAVGRRDCLQVFGGDWPTPDGSGIRDYIHVMDLAEGHRAALDVLLAEPPQLLSLNLGSGQGHSVLEVVRAFELASGRSVPYTVVGRRDGDAASTVADPRLATTRLGWRTRRSLEEMCRDGWTWQQANPEGYGS